MIAICQVIDSSIQRSYGPLWFCGEATTGEITDGKDGYCSRKKHSDSQCVAFLYVEESLLVTYWQRTIKLSFTIFRIRTAYYGKKPI